MVEILLDDQYTRDATWCGIQSAVYPVSHRRIRFWIVIKPDPDTICLSVERGNLDREEQQRGGFGRIVVEFDDDLQDRGLFTPQIGRQQIGDAVKEIGIDLG